LGAKTVYRAVVEDKLGNKPAFSTAAFKNENSALSSKFASVGVCACTAGFIGSGSRGALLQADRKRQVDSTKLLAILIVLNIFI
jgi:hypothetical protein